ncbi:MAG TPA: methyltransferase [Vicinamibacterales bacterium]|jgi:hypothetical protein
MPSVGDSLREQPSPDFVARLARWRVPSGFAFAAVVLWLAQPGWRSLAVGGGVALVGEAVRVWAAGHLRKSREVTVSGPYRWTRHPLYAGSIIIGIGLAMIAHSAAAALVILVYLGVMITAAIRSEEAFLTRTFGARYARYRAQGAGAASGEVDRRFSLAQAMANREYRAIAGLAITLAVLAAKGWLIGTL